MKLNDQKKASRRGFLEQVASGAAALGIASIAAPVKATAGFSFHSLPGVEDWFKKIKGKHRIVFDAPEYNDGMPLAWPRVFQITNSNAGVAAEELGIVVILRHNALPLALDSKLWEKYKLGEFFKINDPVTNTASKRNFYWQPKAGELPLPGMAINELSDSGVLFATCEMAILHSRALVAKQLGLNHETVRKEWIAGLLPGVQTLPSGVLGVNRAQEHGCSYCFAG